MSALNRGIMPLALAAAGLACGYAAQADAPCYGVMFRTGSQTSGLGPILYDVDTTTGACTNPRQLNVNIAVDCAVDPATGIMYGLTDQLGRINNQSGSAGKNLIFRIDIPTGQCTAVGQLDPTNTTSSGPLAVYEGDLAFHPQTGVLWGVTTRIDFARLFTVDLSTGLGATVADITPGVGIQLDLSAIAFDAQGGLWALDTRYPSQPGPAKVYRISPTSGAILQTYQTSTTLGTVAGMDFDPATGAMLVVDGDFGGTNKLYRFDEPTGTLIEIGATGVAVGNSAGLAGLAFGPSAQQCAADIDGDGDVGGTDLSALLSAWGTSTASADIDGNGMVNATDLTLLLAAWGACG